MLSVDHVSMLPRVCARWPGDTHPLGLHSDHDEQATVVACAPLFNAIHGPNRDAVVEAARGEDVVQLVVACRRWVPAGR